METQGDVLMLDLATATGWAQGPVGGTPLFGTFTLPKTGDNIGHFLVAFDAWLTGRIAAHRPARVYFESPILGKKTSITTARKLTGLAGVTEMVCYRASVPVEEVSLTSIKLWFAGHGRAEKHHMIARACAMGWDVQDDNQADACGGWLYSCAIIDPTLRSMASPRITVEPKPKREPRQTKAARKPRKSIERGLPF